MGPRRENTVFPRRWVTLTNNTVFACAVPPVRAPEVGWSGKVLDYEMERFGFHAPERGMCVHSTYSLFVWLVGCFTSTRHHFMMALTAALDPETPAAWEFFYGDLRKRDRPTYSHCSFSYSMFDLSSVSAMGIPQSMSFSSTFPFHFSARWEAATF